MANHDVTSVEQLRSLYREPSDRVANKKGDRLTGAAADFVTMSRFFCLSTAGVDGSCDVSPRGGPAGQLKILNDGTQIAFPDLSGNNLIDSLLNIAVNPHAGLLVMVPGSDETLRIDGPARITTDPELLALWDEELRRPKVAVVIDVEAAFLHCAKAFRRGGVWQSDEWETIDDTVAPKVFNDTAGTSTDPSEMRQFLEADYKESLAAEKA